ncbi:DUF4209 domain-containing protein [Nostoc sp.]|uniref:DUF4209 domain-containing protein n=1 Tax=Nostoc sp. TaxID=1180 RepID=UPI002FF44D09
MSQFRSVPQFELSDFDKYQWTEILDKKIAKECQNYSEEFRLKSEVYKSSGDSIAQEIFKFLSEITSLLMEPQSLPAVEEMITSALSDHHLAILRGLAIKITDPEMLARLADILWICKRDPENARPIQMAKVAVESYLQSARNLEDTENWMSCYERLQRAAQLAPLIDGKKNSVIRYQVFNHIDKLIDRYLGIDNEFLTGSAMKVLQEEFGKKSLNIIHSNFSSYATKYATIAAQKAVSMDKFPDYHRAFYHKKAYRDIESEWYKIAGDKKSERIAKLYLAEVEVWYAEQALVENEHNFYSVAAGRLENALRVFKKIEDTFGKKQETSARLEELHKQMLDYQKESMSNIFNIPLSEGENNDFTNPQIQQIAIELVKEKSLYDALYSLAFGANLIQRFEDVESEAKQDIESHKISYLIPIVLVDEEGKTKAVSRSEDALVESMFRIANFYQCYYGLNFIAPACNQICSEHNISLDDLSFIVNENPFIPKGREPLYARGLIAGLKGDLVVATHLLIPQLENSLRHILKLNGSITSHLQLQHDYTLGKVLELPDLKQLLTENTIFSLRCLLIEPLGSNLRNEICHGLFDYHRFFAPEVLYLWWLTLYLSLVPSYRQWASKTKEE